MALVLVGLLAIIALVYMGLALLNAATTVAKKEATAAARTALVGACTGLLNEDNKLVELADNNEDNLVLVKKTVVEVLRRLEETPLDL